MTAAALATTLPLPGAAAPAAAVPVRGPRHAEPDFGPHVRLFGPRTPPARIQAALDAAADEPASAERGAGPCVFLFRPGSYDVEVRLGSRTAVAGLGLLPDDVTINGAVPVADREQPGGGDGAPADVWRSASNLAFVPGGGATRWAAHGAATLRRVHVRGPLLLLPGEGGGAGGGVIADCVVDGQVVNASGRQWLARDSSVAGWSAPLGGQVLAGVEGAPARSLPDPLCTALPTSPFSREKPFLYVDGRGAYRVFLPAPRRDAVGPTWTSGAPEGTSVPLERFFLAQPGDSVRTLNRALAQGRHLLLTPGVYELSDTIRVKWAGTVVLGLGHPTLRPRHGAAAMTVADARGVRLAGLLFEAGPRESRALLAVGDRRGGRTDPREPASVQDVFFRIGGAGPGRAAAALVVDSGNVLLDHVRAWRAGHGAGANGPVATASPGVVVNGADVVATGLFVERFQKHEVVWNGESGRAVMVRHGLPDGSTERSGRVCDGLPAVSGAGSGRSVAARRAG
jgi:hypothetical protein